MKPCRTSASLSELYRDTITSRVSFSTTIANCSKPKTFRSSVNPKLSSHEKSATQVVFMSSRAVSEEAYDKGETLEYYVNF